MFPEPGLKPWHELKPEPKAHHQFEVGPFTVMRASAVAFGSAMLVARTKNSPSLAEAE
jgi:hypothetical protein